MQKAAEQTATVAEDNYKATLRKIGLEAAKEKVDTVGTISDMQQSVKKRLEEHDILTVKVGAGEHTREMSLANYSVMVARSTSREVGNTARLNQLTANGYDLVEIPSHYPTCEICSILQDRVYSISGNDKRFPPLSRAFGSGYKIIHPNCRHVVVAWIESMHTAKEIEDAIKRSTRSWVDARTGEEVKFYNDLQTKARRARDLRAQFERYKDRLGADAPKSLMAFKRLKNGGGDKWEELQNAYKQAGVDKTQKYGTLNEVVQSKYYTGELKEYEVTDQNVEKIKPMNVNGFTEEESEKLCQAEKELLNLIRTYPVGTEGVICLNMDLSEKDRYVGDLATGTVNLKRYKDDCIILHNHPDGLIFSEKDYIQFSQNQEIKGLAAVGNNGNIFYIQKTDAFNSLEFDFETFAIRQKYPDKMNYKEHLQYSEEVFEEMMKYGVKTYAAAIK